MLRKLTYAEEKFQGDGLVEDFQDAVGEIADRRGLMPTVALPPLLRKGEFVGPIFLVDSTP
ncbi:MAG: hypothetical protein ACYDCD_02575 [Candidatus Acidiferrales bacterium]